MLCFQVFPLANGDQLQAQLHAQVEATAKSYGRQLARRYPGGVQAGTVLGDPRRPAPGLARAAPDGTLGVPAVAGPVHGNQGSPLSWRSPPTARSSRPLRRPGTHPERGGQRTPRPGGHVNVRRPPVHKGGSVPTPYGGVLFWVDGPAGRCGPGHHQPARRDWRTTSMSRCHRRRRVRQPHPRLARAGPAQRGRPAAVGSVACSWRRAGRRTVRAAGLMAPCPPVRRLERAAVAVADSDYTVALPSPGGRVGRLESNFTAMTRQLGSALAAERQRATGDARAAERARMAREVRDAISEHLFRLRMIAAGISGRPGPSSRPVRSSASAKKHCATCRHCWPRKLSRASLDGAGLAPALQRSARPTRPLGVAVDAALDDVTLPVPVGAPPAHHPGGLRQCRPARPRRRARRVHEPPGRARRAGRPRHRRRGRCGRAARQLRGGQHPRTGSPNSAAP